MQPGDTVMVYRWQPSYHYDEPSDYEETRGEIVSIDGDAVTVAAGKYQYTVKADSIEDAGIYVDDSTITARRDGSPLPNVYEEFAHLYAE